MKSVWIIFFGEGDPPEGYYTSEEIARKKLEEQIHKIPGREYYWKGKAYYSLYNNWPMCEATVEELQVLE